MYEVFVSHRSRKTIRPGFSIILCGLARACTMDTPGCHTGNRFFVFGWLSLHGQWKDLSTQDNESWCFGHSHLRSSPRLRENSWHHHQPEAPNPNLPSTPQPTEIPSGCLRQPSPPLNKNILFSWLTSSPDLRSLSSSRKSNKLTSTIPLQGECFFLRTT